MAQKTKHCENCGKVLGKLELAYVYEGRVVCHQWNESLRHPTVAATFLKEALAHYSQYLVFWE